MSSSGGGTWISPLDLPLLFMMAGEEDDDESVEKVARDIIDRHGSKAELWTRDQADIADGQGDAFSPETWREIAHAINRLLN